MQAYAHAMLWRDKALSVKKTYEKEAILKNKKIKGLACNE